MNNQQNNKNDKNDKDNKKKNAKILAIFLIVSILGTFFFNSILTKWRNGTEKTISYNKFVTMLDKDQVKSVKVTDSQLKVTPKNEGNPFYKTTYTVQRISGDYELVNRLIKSKIAFEQEPEDPMDTFLSILISLIPTIVIFGFLVMMMRRSSGMMGVGKSNAKVYVEKKTGVTFADVAGQLVLGMVLVFMFYFVDKVGISATEEEVSAAVTGFSANFQFQDGTYYLSEDTQFYHDGVMFCVYDDNGKLLYGTMPEKFPKQMILKSHTPRVITSGSSKWMVYDSVHTYGKNKAIWIRGITSIHAIEVFMTTSQKMMIVLYPVFILLIAMTGYFMLKRALKQVDLICDQVENISYGKDLTKRLPLPKVRDELYELSHKFNQMFERLEESFEKEQQFTADVSHELRTPVTVIISQCEYLIEDPVLEEEEKEEIMIILRQARRMSKLINEMLMIARGEMSESYDMEEVDLILLTEVIVEELHEQAEKKKIQISVSSDRDVKMMGNHTLLLRMMMNLVQNAISYGKEHGHIDILWKEQGDMIIGEVKDDGIGIDQEDIPKIWDRFYRVDKSRSRENGGTGLGLSMVHFIVAVHGGQIHVESKNGEGTSFIFQFPKILESRKG